MKRHGEDIIITEKGEMPSARAAAARLSRGQHHSWANLWYVCTRTKLLTREVYYEGSLYRREQPATYDGWYTAKLTILQAIGRYGYVSLANRAHKLYATRMANS